MIRQPMRCGGELNLAKDELLRRILAESLGVAYLY